MKKIFQFLVIYIFSTVVVYSQILPYNQEFMVNTYPFSSGDQEDPKIAMLTSGSQIICWDSWQDNQRGVYAQMFDENGLKKGEEIHVNTYILKDQRFPEVASLPHGRFVICWQSDGQDGASWGIFAQIYDSSGLKKSDEFQVNTYWKNSQFHPKIKSFSNGEFMICWESDGQDSSGYGILAQIFNEDGTRKGEEFQISNSAVITSPANNSSYTYYRYGATISIFPSGNFIGWVSINLDSSMKYINVQLYNAEGVPKGSRYLIDTTLIGYPQSYVLNSGNILFIWKGGGNYSNPCIFAKIIDTNGNTIKKKFQVNTSTEWWSWSPNVAILPSGGFAVCWEYFNINAGFGYIKAQLFDNNGNKNGNEISLDYDNSSPSNPSITFFSDGGFIVCWDRYDGVGIGNNVYAQIYDNKGVPQNNKFRISTNSGTNPLVLALPEKGVLMLWLGDGIFAKYLNETSSVNVKMVKSLPDNFSLFQNYPNPFNPSTNISFSIAEKSFVTLKIFDLNGREVALLVSEELPAGEYSRQWDAQNMASGLYLYRLQTASYLSTKKMLFLK